MREEGVEEVPAMQPSAESFLIAFPMESVEEEAPNKHCSLSGSTPQSCGESCADAAVFASDKNGSHTPANEFVRLSEKNSDFKETLMLKLRNILLYRVSLPLRPHVTFVRTNGLAL